MKKRSRNCDTLGRTQALSAVPLSERSCTPSARRRARISLFGIFGVGNFGNNITLKAAVYHLGRFVPNAEVTCICSGPEVVAADYQIPSVPITGTVVRRWPFRNPLARLAQKVFVGIPSEVYRWLTCFKRLWHADVLMIPGTGILTDAFGLMSNAGPYSVWKWTVIAKLCRCNVFFVSVGAGPIYGRLSKFLIKSALGLADYRSYRDESTLRYLKSIGFVRSNDRVYPDLAFSLPDAHTPQEGAKVRQRLVVGLGVMQYAGKYSTERPCAATYRRYLEALVILVSWLLAHEYDVRLLIGDTCDAIVSHELSHVLNERLSIHDAGRVIDEPPVSIASLLSQFETTDMVVATRFHNVLLSLLMNKPVIAISFHHKVSSLMSSMGLSDYCFDIHDFTAEDLIAKVRDVEHHAETLRSAIKTRAEACREALEEQYKYISNLVSRS